MKNSYFYPKYDKAQWAVTARNKKALLKKKSKNKVITGQAAAAPSEQIGTPLVFCSQTGFVLSGPRHFNRVAPFAP